MLNEHLCLPCQVFTAHFVTKALPSIQYQWQDKNILSCETCLTGYRIVQEFDRGSLMDTDSLNIC